jgi:hypothetical protein
MPLLIPTQQECALILGLSFGTYLDWLRHAPPGREEGCEEELQAGF